MSSDKGIILRYRAPGHVRFQIAGELCASAPRRSIETGLREVEGIYRVDFFERQRKVSIRFVEAICSFDRLNDVFSRVVADTVSAAPVPGCCAVEPTALMSPPTVGRSGFAPLNWVRAKLGGIGRPLGSPAGAQSPTWLKEATVVEFLNDALVLFLIKLHWHMITQHWLRLPWRYRYEWMAALYMIFLLVRSRRPKKT